MSQSHASPTERSTSNNCRRHERARGRRWAASEGSQSGRSSSSSRRSCSAPAGSASGPTAPNATRATSPPASMTTPRQERRWQPRRPISARPASTGCTPRACSGTCESASHQRVRAPPSCRNRPLCQRRPLPRRRALHARLRLLPRRGADDRGRPAAVGPRTAALLGRLRHRNRSSDRPLGAGQGVVERGRDECRRQTRNRRRRRPRRPHAGGAVDRDRLAGGRSRLHDRWGAADRRCVPRQPRVHIRTRRRSHVHDDDHRARGGRDGRAGRRCRPLSGDQAVLDSPGSSSCGRQRRSRWASSPGSSRRRSRTA